MRKKANNQLSYNLEDNTNKEELRLFKCPSGYIPSKDGQCVRPGVI